MMSRSECPALFSPSYDEAAGERAVAEDGDDLVRLLAARSRAVAMPSAADIGGAGVAGAELVVLALACA